MKKFLFTLIAPSLVIAGLLIPELATFVTVLLCIVYFITIVIFAFGTFGIAFMKNNPNIIAAREQLYKFRSNINPYMYLYEIAYIVGYLSLLWIFSPFLFNLGLVVLIMAKLFNLIALKETDMPLIKALL